MKNTYKLVWSDEALNNLQDIINYLEVRWTKREIEKFARLLDKQLSLICENPKLFSKVKSPPNLRKSILSKQTTIYFSLKNHRRRRWSCFKGSAIF